MGKRKIEPPGFSQSIPMRKKVYFCLELCIASEEDIVGRGTWCLMHTSGIQWKQSSRFPPKLPQSGFGISRRPLIHSRARLKYQIPHESENFKTIRSNVPIQKRIIFGTGLSDFLVVLNRFQIVLDRLRTIFCIFSVSSSSSSSLRRRFRRHIRSIDQKDFERFWKKWKI